MKRTETPSASHPRLRPDPGTSPGSEEAFVTLLLNPYFALGVFVAVFFGFFLFFFLSLFPIFKLLSTRVNLILALMAIWASLIQRRAHVPVRDPNNIELVVHAVLDPESGEI